MGLFEIRLQCDRSLKRYHRSGRIATRFQFHAQVALSFGILWIDFNGSAELREGASMAALTAQCHTEEPVGRGKPRVKTERLTKFSRGLVQVAELSLDNPQFEI